MRRVLFNYRSRSRRDQQRGMALMLAIAMLLLLSILGATVLDIASRDVRSSGQVGAESQVFYAADRIVAFGQHRVDMVLDTLTDSMEGQSWPITDPTGGSALDGLEPGSGLITFVGRTELEILRSSKRTPAKGNVFHVEAIATDSANVPNRISVDTTYVKILSVLAEDKTVTGKDLKELADAAAK